MPKSLIVPLAIAVILLVATIACVIIAPRLPKAIRVVASLVLVLLGLFGAYGVVASGEPGDYHVVWQVGYAVLFLACLAAMVRLVVVRQRHHS